MKKLELSLDALRVEAFAPEAAPDAKGTVQGHDFDATRPNSQCLVTCDPSCETLVCIC